MVLVSTSLELLLRCPEALALLFADDVKMVTRWIKNMNLHRRNGTNQSTMLSAYTSPLGEELPLRLSFFLDCTGIPILVSKLVKDFGTNSLYSPFSQFLEAAC